MIEHLFQRINLEGTEVDVKVALSEEVDGILKKFHDKVGHPGINSTYLAIQQQYYWKGMFTDVSQYVSAESINLFAFLCIASLY